MGRCCIIYWGDYVDKGWKLETRTFKVVYDSLFVEVDYMADHVPDVNALINNILTPIASWYQTHGPHNIVFSVGSAVPHDDHA